MDHFVGIMSPFQFLAVMLNVKSSRKGDTYANHYVFYYIVYRPFGRLVVRSSVLYEIHVQSFLPINEHLNEFDTSMLKNVGLI